jgi:COP9 signalosome complex subunit 3
MYCVVSYRIVSYGIVFVSILAAVDSIFHDHSIDPVHHTYAYIQFLVTRAFSDFRSTNLIAEYLSYIHDLFMGINMYQASYCMADLYTICKWYSKLVVQLQRPIYALMGLRHTLQQIAQRYPNTLTPIHTEFIILCVRSKQYRIARSLLLSQPLYQVRPKQEGFTPLDFLLFYYYSGLVYSAYKMWKEATEAWQMVGYI